MVVLLAAVVLTHCLLISRTSLFIDSYKFQLNTMLAIAMTLLICPFDNLYVNILLEIFISMLLTLQVASIEVVVVVILLVVNVTVTVVLAVVSTYCLLIETIFPFKYSLKVPT